MKRQFLLYGSYTTMFYMIVTLGGLLFGVIAWLCLPELLVQQMETYVLSQMQSSAEVFSAGQTIAQIFRANTMDLLRVYLCGICLLGLPILALLLFLKCFSIGFAGCILLHHSVLLLFARLIYIPVFVLAVSFGCRFAWQLIQNNISSPIRQLIQYSGLFVLLLLLAALASVVDGLASYYYLQGMI